MGRAETRMLIGDLLVQVEALRDQTCDLTARTCSAEQLLAATRRILGVGERQNLLCALTALVEERNALRGLARDLSEALLAKDVATWTAAECALHRALTALEEVSRG